MPEVFLVLLSSVYGGAVPIMADPIPQPSMEMCMANAVAADELFRRVFCIEIWPDGTVIIMRP